jgi:hypothetical protein
MEISKGKVGVGLFRHRFLHESIRTSGMILPGNDPADLMMRDVEFRDKKKREACILRLM